MPRTKKAIKTERKTIVMDLPDIETTANAPKTRSRKKYNSIQDHANAIAERLAKRNTPEYKAAQRAKRNAPAAKLRRRSSTLKTRIALYRNKLQSMEKELSVLDVPTVVLQST